MKEHVSVCISFVCTFPFYFFARTGHTQFHHEDNKWITDAKQKTNQKQCKNKGQTTGSLNVW